MTMQDSIDALLGQAAEIGGVPGVVAVVTDRDGPIYEGAFGKRDLSGDAPMTLDTVGWIASMTKAVTGTAAMQMVERGKLNLDTPAADVVPDLADPQVLEGFGADGEPVLRPAGRPITLRHLLTHTSGLVYNLWSAEMARYLEATGKPAVTTCERAALDLPLAFEPGERWQYGIGIDWAGLMVEAVTGQRLGDYLRENVFEPLGMDDTAFRITPGMRRRLATVHARTPDGALVPIEFELPQEPEFEMGGGGLYSTAPDYAKFVRMILNGGAADGNRVLQPDTVDLMSRNAIGDLRVQPLTSAVPDATNDAEFFPGVPKSWGLTFQINEQQAPTGLPAGSLMWAGLANSYYWIDRETGIGGVYVTQILPFVDTVSAPLFHGFQTAVYDAMG